MLRYKEMNKERDILIEKMREGEIKYIELEKNMKKEAKERDKD